MAQSQTAESTAAKSSPSMLIILGMHRSGTSALTGLFHDLGLDLGKNLMQAQADNPDGFWENQSIVDLHDEFLEFIGSAWDDLRLIPDEVWERPEVGDYRFRLVDLLRSEFDSSSRTWCIKDPRMCRLLPLWEPVFDAVGRRPEYLICSRHPYEVAASLKRRNSFSIEKSLYLWLQHNLVAERDTRSVTASRAFVSFEGLLVPPQPSLDTVMATAERLGVDADKMSRQTLEAVFDSGKRHNSSALTGRVRGGMSDEALALENLLERAADGANAELSAECDRSIDSYQSFSKLLPPEVSGRIEKARDDLANELEQRNVHVAGFETEIERLEAATKTVHEDYAVELKAVHTNYETEIEKARLERAEESAKATAQIEASEGEVQSLREKIIALTTQVSDLGAAAARADEERHTIVRHRDREFARYEHRLGHASGADFDRLVEEVRRLTEEVEARCSEVDENQAEISIRGEVIAERDAEIAAQRKQAKSDQKKIEDLEEKLRELAGYIDSVESSSAFGLVRRPLRKILRSRPKIKIPELPRTKALPEKGTQSADEEVVSDEVPDEETPSGDEAIDAEVMPEKDPGPVPLEPETIVVPETDEPVVSIVIPVYNNIGYTTRCVQSIVRKSDFEATPYEVIVSDDCSTDETETTCKAISGLRYHRNAENRGFGFTCNAGADEARGDYVLFLNNDTTVTDDWLRSLIATFDQFPNAGYVGSKLVYPDGSLQEAGGIIWKDGSGWNFGREMDPQAPEFNHVRHVDYVSAAACVLPVDLWKEVGGFSPEFEPAYYEDTDLAFKVRDAGREVLYQPFSEVVHYEGKSSGTDITSGVKRYQAVNQPKFVNKWQRELAKRPENADIEGAMRPVAGGCQRILFIDDIVPMPDQASGGVRAFNILKVLARLGHAVTFIGENPHADEKYRRPLQELGVRVLYSPHYESLEDYLYRDLKHHCQSRQFDTIVIARHMIARRYLNLLREMCPDSRIIFDTVDLHYLRQEREAELHDDAVGLAGAGTAKQLEYEIMARTEQTWVVSDAEVEIIADEVPEIDVRIVSNVIDVVGTEVTFSDRKDICFIGGYQHPPNIDAVIWFADEVWPLVQEKLPKLSFRIAGSAAPPEVEALGRRDGIEFLGFVDSAEDLFEECRLSVAPLRYGAGVKGKINQSMSLGVPVISTRVGAEGMGLEHDHDVLVADDPEAFADAIVRAYQDEKLWKQLQENGLDTMRRLFSLEAMESRLVEIFGGQESS